MKYIFFSILFILSWHNYSQTADLYEKFRDQVKQSDCIGLHKMFNDNYDKLNEQDLNAMLGKINDCLNLVAYHRDRKLYAQKCAIIEAEKRLAHLKDTINACSDRHSDRELNQLRDRVSDRMNALGYMRAHYAHVQSSLH